MTTEQTHYAPVDAALAECEAARLRAEVDRLTADHAGARAERDFYRSALAEADAAAREARAERDALAKALAAVRAVVAMVPTEEA